MYPSAFPTQAAADRTTIRNKYVQETGNCAHDSQEMT
jgi:hypothetical protein